MSIALTQAITQSVTFTQMPNVNGSHRCHTQYIHVTVPTYALHYVTRNIALTVHRLVYISAGAQGLESSSQGAQVSSSNCVYN